MRIVTGHTSTDPRSCGRMRYAPSKRPLAWASMV